MKNIAYFNYNGAKFIKAKRENHAIVFDSWLVQDGFTAGLDLHAFRLHQNINSFISISKAEILNIYQLVLDMIPLQGIFFIKLTFNSRYQIQLVIRIPEGKDYFPPKIVLDSHTFVDKRFSPQIKGPDMQWQRQCRQMVLQHKAVEGFIVDYEGYIREGIFSAMIWWEKGVIFYPQTATKLVSVTLALIIRIAKLKNIKTSSKSVRITDLLDKPVWLLNSLQGIKFADNWLNGSIIPRNSALESKWKIWWEVCMHNLADWKNFLYNFQ